MKTKEKKIGIYKRSWLLNKGAWRALQLDKELLALPFLALLASLLVLAIGGIGFVASTGGSFDSAANQDVGPIGYLLLFGLYVGFAFVTNFFGAAIIHAALQRFAGHDPNLRSSIAAAKKQVRSIAVFSLFSATIGYVLGFIEQRVPFGGKVVTWLAQLAWGVASFFAIPVIVTEDKYIGPVSATKRSVAVIKKAWGESVVSQLSLGVLQAMITIIYVAIGVGIGVNAAIAGLSTGIVAGFSVLAILGLVAIFLVFSAMGSILQAAVYHYAVTGESPLHFDKKLIQAAMTPKKARKIFG